MESLLNGLVNWGSELLNAEVTRMTLAFLIAARLHRRWVKKDVTEQISGVTEAINNLSSSMRDNFNHQTKRIDELSQRVDNLEQH